MLFRTLALIALFGFSFSSNAYADVASCIQNAERDKDAIMCAYRSFLDSDNTLNEVYQATLQGNRLDEQTNNIFARLNSVGSNTKRTFAMLRLEPLQQNAT